MLAIALNPGFVLLIGAMLALATPASLRPPLMTLSALGALGLLLSPSFGRYDAFAQIGLTMVPLTLDALNQVFGLAFIGVAILVAIYASGRRSRFEDAALMLLAGASISALFVGDLVSFVAAAELAGLAAAGVVFCGGGAEAYAAGVRFLMWRGLEGLLLLAGVAFQLSDGLRNEFGLMNARTIGGALFLAGLAVRVGAPFAHVWLKDVASCATPVGAVALATFTPLLGVYALARAFPGEPLLVQGGVAMIALGAVFACAEDDLRSALSYSLIAQIGVAVAALGLGAAAFGAATAFAFTLAFSYALLFMALGRIVAREDTASAHALAGAGRSAPFTTAVLAIGGFAAAGAPGFASYAALAPIRAAAAGVPEMALALMAALGAAACHTALRPALALGVRSETPASPRTPGFAMMLAMSLALFLCFAIGVSPNWLYALAPNAPLGFAPYTPPRLAETASLLGGAGIAYLALRWTRLAQAEPGRRLLDIDALYRGPLARAGRWMGVVLLRVYGAWREAGGLASQWSGAALTRFAARGDRPYQDQAGGTLALLSAALLLAIVLVARWQDGR